MGGGREPSPRMIAAPWANRIVSHADVVFSGNFDSSGISTQSDAKEPATPRCSPAGPWVGSTNPPCPRARPATPRFVSD